MTRQGIITTYVPVLDHDEKDLVVGAGPGWGWQRSAVCVCAGHIILELGEL